MFEQTPESHTNPPDTSKRDAEQESAYERFIAELCVEDTDAALDWHAAEYGNSYLNSVLSNWHNCPAEHEEKLIERTNTLEAAVDEILKKYVDEVLWPAHIKNQ